LEMFFNSLLGCTESQLRCWESDREIHVARQSRELPPANVSGGRKL
jgi:hypothetical protein